MATKQRRLNKIIPIVLFPTLSVLAINFIFKHMFRSGLAKKMSAGCPWHAPSDPSDYPFRLQYYTGVHATNTALCMLGTFFRQNFTAKLFPFFSYFSGQGFLFNIWPAVEARRRGRPSILAHTILLGVLNKTTSVATAMPLWFLILILTGTATVPTRRSGDRYRLTNADVVAVILGVLIGNIVPTVVMLVTKQPRAIAFWQYYPFWMYLSQRLGNRLCSPKLQQQSGHKNLRKLWITAFVVAVAAHIYYVWPKLDDVDKLKTFLVPSFHALPANGTSFESGAYDFMKWDFTIGFTSAILATFWFARTKIELLSIIAWHVFGSPLIGPGASVLAVLIWREDQIQADNESKGGVKVE